MRVLVLNAGSSSLKFALTDAEEERHLLRGRVERVGEAESLLVLGGEKIPVSAPDHRAALQAVLEHAELGRIEAVGHRVVHGGTIRESRVIDEALIERIRALIPLAPLHNPANLAGIEAAKKLFPETPQVAVFDTAFHQTLPPEAYHYAIPAALAGAGYRRYGFHGISHAHVSRKAAALFGARVEKLRLVTLHLGNGASATAVLGGKSVATSMGFTPLEGLVMGTRPGDLDPGLVLALAREKGVAEVERILNRESGLKGLSGLSHDLRDLHRAAAEGHEGARLALRAYVRRIVFYVGGYAALLGGIDALVFTAGVGENDPWVRAEVVRGLGALGFVLDEAKNEAGGPVITRGTPAALVVPTDEELEIALETRRVLTER